MSVSKVFCFSPFHLLVFYPICQHAKNACSVNSCFSISTKLLAVVWHWKRSKSVPIAFLIYTSCVAILLHNLRSFHQPTVLLMLKRYQRVWLWSRMGLSVDMPTHIFSVANLLCLLYTRSHTNFVKFLVNWFYAHLDPYVHSHGCVNHYVCAHIMFIIVNLWIFWFAIMTCGKPFMRPKQY